MSIVRRYYEYLRDNPERYWFKRKAWGWGWVPARWQGWAVILIWAAVLAALIVYFIQMRDPSENDTIRFILEVFASAASLIWVCYTTGEPPRWMWGIPEKETIENFK